MEKQSCFELGSEQDERAKTCTKSKAVSANTISPEKIQTYLTFGLKYLTEAVATVFSNCLIKRRIQDKG